MSMFKTEAEFNAAAKQAIDRSFDAWLGQPTIRVLISTIPEGSTSEALSALLRSAYESGFAAGQGHAMVDMIQSVFASRERRGRE